MASFSHDCGQSAPWNLEVGGDINHKKTLISALSFTFIQVLHWWSNMGHRQAVPVGPWAADFPRPWAGRFGWFGICLVTLGHVESPVLSPSFIASSERAHKTFLPLLKWKILQLNPSPVFQSSMESRISHIPLYLIFTSSLNFLWSQLLLLHFSFSVVQQANKKIVAYSVAESCK